MNDIKSIKKIDIHAHATPFREYYPPYSMDGKEIAWVSDTNVIELYDKLNIEKGVLLALSSPEGLMAPISSEECKFLADKHPNRFFWFCGVDPRAFPNTDDGDLEHIIKHYKKLGAKGVGEITAHIYADDIKLMNLYSACEKNDMPIIIHISPSFESGYGIYDDVGLPRIEKILKTFPSLKVIGHSGGFWHELSSNLTQENRQDAQTSKVQDGNRIVELMRKYPNLYCDISAQSGATALMRDKEFTLKFLNEFSQRVMYGCDICLPHQTFSFALAEFLEGLVLKGELSVEVYKKLVRDNAIRILKLDM